MIINRGTIKAASDESLAARHLRGDPQAFPELAARYTAPIYNLAWRFTRDPMEAENITQETFVRVLNALPRVALDRPLRPWFFKIALNLCRQWAERKRPPAFSDLDTADDSGLEAVPDDEPSPLEQVTDRELQAYVRRAVDRLSALDQTVIVMRFAEGMSYQEIAEAMELPLNTVRTRLRRAKLRLRRALEVSGVWST